MMPLYIAVAVAGAEGKRKDQRDIHLELKGTAGELGNTWR